MKIAITGGIGAGKSFVCDRLRTRGIAVYDCDDAAKRLMRTSRSLQTQLTELVGDDVYVGGTLQKAVLAKFILADDANVEAVNGIIHPAVARDFEASGYDWLESAIYFDSSFDRRVSVDRVICVTAPTDIRIARVMSRDGISREKTLEWIDRQLPQDEVERRSDYHIVNDGRADIDAQIDRILRQLSSDGAYI